MKVLFAVHDEKVSLSIVKKYQREYKEIISYKNVYYYNAIIKELQRDKTYDRIIIDEELEEFTSTSFEEKDKFIFNKLDNITDEASNSRDKEIPIILICADRRAKGEDVLVKLFGIGIYNAIIGTDRSTDVVCKLINSPRSKKEAKIYYKIDSKAVEYDPEDENDVSEEEMQHILSYFKKLGKNEEKYDEVFKKIASQYNDNQMKIIIAILPQNVKKILQEVSPTYQKYVPNATGGKSKNSRVHKQTEINPTSEMLLNANKGHNKKNIVVPSSIEKNLVKKVTIKSPLATKNDLPKFEDDDDDDDDEAFENLDETPKRRGRPTKKVDESDEPIKKKRGRPPKTSELEEIVNTESIYDKDSQQESVEQEEQYDNILLGTDDNEKNVKFENRYEPIDERLLRPEPISDDILPGIDDDYEEDDEEDNNASEGYEDIKQDNSYKYEEDNQDDQYNYEENFQEYNLNQKHNYEQEKYNKLGFDNSQVSNMEIQSYEQTYDDFDYTNYNNLLSSDRKVIAFVGTSKNGTSFIVNNIAKILSENGINTAILDATQNKNSYYIYNNNDDSLRNAAASSLEDISQGIVGGMKVSKNLSIYVEIPGQNSTKINDAGPILENLAKNYSATLIDCDFSTPVEYFANAQEIFLVQSMDVLTIQPLTAFLKELKNRDILEQHKIRIIMNKALRLRGITSKQIVGGMSRYNNPEMSMMTELFDRNLIVPIEIPFDIDVYARYLEGLADCNISVNKYPKDFQNILNKLSNVIYPLLPAKRSKEKNKKGYDYSTNNYSNGFSNNVNNTLNNMRKKY